MKRVTLDEFISKANLKHGCKYDYSKVDYKGVDTKVCIICPEHGEFWQTPYNHLIGQGCPECGKIRRSRSRSLNNEKFIQKARMRHGDKYDYSKVDYKTSVTPVCITCPEHGDFLQKPSAHIRGMGCPRCNGGVKYTQVEFIEKAKKVHNDHYDYSKVVYKNAYEKVCIVCPEHGEFWQRPASHLRGAGCPKCYAKQRLTTSEFIERARGVHGDKYDYSKVEYVNDRTPVCIICKKHGEFWQSPDKHIHSKQGCPKCSGKGLTRDELIDEFVNTHGDKYDYSKVDFRRGSRKIDKVCIICPEHGEFWQTPQAHRAGEGCPRCGYESIRKLRADTKDDFVRKARAVYGDIYDYDAVEYINAKTSVLVGCRKHGLFSIKPDIHVLSKCGCPMCSAKSSLPEEELVGFIRDVLQEDVEVRKRSMISGKELDIFVPTAMLAIEYNGLYWHCENQGKDKTYHLNKTLLCQNAGIKLMHIFSDEYAEKKDLIMSILRKMIKPSSLMVVDAGSCEVKQIDKSNAVKFFNENCIDGAPKRMDIAFGAYANGLLVGVMAMRQVKPNTSKWLITRASTSVACFCEGVITKIFGHFVSLYSPAMVSMSIDRRMPIDDAEYRSIGFVCCGYSEPDYTYYSPKFRENRFSKNTIRREVLIRRYGSDPTDSEADMIRKLGFSKVWNCGTVNYEWTDTSTDFEEVK